jgi:hypothetical protein
MKTKTGKVTAKRVTRVDIEKAVAALFLTWNNEPAETLRLRRKDGRDLGGWSKRAAADWMCKELGIE